MGICRSTKRHWCHTSTFEILGVVGCFNMEFSVFFLGGEQLPTPTYKISCFLVGKAIFGPVRHCQALCLLMLYKCCFILMHGKSPALTNPMKFVCVILLFLSNKCLSNFFQIWPTDLCVWRVDGLSSVEKECRIHWKRPQRGRREVHLFWLYRTMWW